MKPAESIFVAVERARVLGGEGVPIEGNVYRLGEDKRTLHLINGTDSALVARMEHPDRAPRVRAQAPRHPGWMHTLSRARFAHPGYG
jgi:hypothetical protein